jgi:hypothetical protein
MKQFQTFGFLLAAAVALGMPAASVAAPAAASVYLPFNVTASPRNDGSRSLRVTTPGCVTAYVRSSTGSGQLKLSLASSSGTTRQAIGLANSSAGVAPTAVSVALSASDVSRNPSWVVTVAAVSGNAQGAVRIEYPPAQTPCELQASNSGGRTNLIWRYTGRTFAGNFLVERSTNGRTWAAVTTCRRPVTAATRYSCTDTSANGTAAFYRACAISSGTACGPANVTPAIRPST